MYKIKLKLYDIIITILINVEDFFNYFETKANKLRIKIDEKVDEIDLKYGEN